MLLIQSSWFSVEELSTEAREQAGEPGGLGGQAELGRLGFVAQSDHFFKVEKLVESFGLFVFHTPCATHVCTCSTAQTQPLLVLYFPCLCECKGKLVCFWFL